MNPLLFKTGFTGRTYFKSDYVHWDIEDTIQDHVKIITRDTITNLCTETHMVLYMTKSIENCKTIPRTSPFFYYFFY